MTARLLEVDRGLGRLLGDEQRSAATAEIVVRLASLPVGRWDTASLEGTAPDHLGLLIVEGMLARELKLVGHPAVELLGPGDVLRPWLLESGDALLAFESTWTAIVPGRLALLDREATSQLGRWPQITAMIADRLVNRARRLAATQAIGRIVGVERRLLCLLWHLADHWGRVTPDGVLIPLPITHSLLGELIGARRPTVSAAVRDLAERGQLQRRPDRTWLLTGRPEDATAFQPTGRRRPTAAAGAEAPGGRFARARHG
jgi:CRP/FNR family transcriptional regulator, cyclic AMP receptor protein